MFQDGSSINLLVSRSGQMRQRINTSADSSASVMAPGQGDASAASCVETSWISGDMIRVLAELQEFGIIYFQKSLTRSPDHNDRKFGPDVQLVLPLCFLQEHGDKFEEYVIFRTQSSAKPWVVQVSIFEEPLAPPQVKFAGGWEEFAADNRLKQGDSLIFVLKVPLPEFEVYIFRGTGRSSSSRAPARNWFNTDHCTRVSEQTVRSLSHGRREEHQKKVRKTGDLLIEKKAVQGRQQNLADNSSDQEYDGQNLGGSSSEVHTGSERNDLASQHGPNSLPDFQKRITTSNIRDGRIEVPASFAKTHGMELQADVKVQGILQESPLRIVTRCWKNQGNQTRLYFQGGWSKFLEENGLHDGQELRFTLTAASSFVVRKV